ncbi:MAG: dTDP-4-dehydrorhamnose 3,5-epimerase family protein [Armatimonadetes bacterium]|nr:dTDP-4-dehydrorhamnose 3,5-epimerase family protein [Armatimonadota bacterium]
MSIPGVIVKPLTTFRDSRGWLTELFRDDELPEGFDPTMGYISCTLPGVARGPHEHVHQTDLFVFLQGSYKLHLWENRPGLQDAEDILDVGEQNPCAVWVPPGVVHAYRNVGDSEAMVLNFPNQLYAGWGKSEQVDEIRHESDPNSRFKL